MRTNIVIDDDLMKKAMKLSGKKTKKETVEKALSYLIESKDQQEILKYRGKIDWQGDLEKMRLD